MANRPERWRPLLERLAAFRRRFGHVNVPRAWREDVELGGWAESLRHRRRRRMELPAELVQGLDSLGFQWNPTRDTWAKRLNELDAYQREHGRHTLPPVRGATRALASWLGHQRARQRRGLLSRARVRALNTRGVRWVPRSFRRHRWEDGFERLKRYRVRHGHTDVPIDDPDKTLARWVRKQRRFASDGTLLPERRRKLARLGFTFAVIGRTRAQRFAEAESFRKKHGHLVVPPKGDTVLLARWLRLQRRRRRLGRLPQADIRRLSRLGLSWHTARKPEPLDAWVDALLAYRAATGHWSIDSLTPNELQAKAQRLRLLRRRRTIAHPLLRRLDAAEFPWTVHEAAWEDRYAALSRFSSSHPRALPPPETPLAVWLKRQRTDNLTPAQWRRLRALTR